MKIKNENERNSSLLKLEILVNRNQKTRSMIDATSATCVRTLSVTRRSIVDRLNVYFFVYTKFIIRTLTSHISFPLVDRKHAFSHIYDLCEIFPRRSVRIVFFFSYPPYSVQAKSCQKRSLWKAQAVSNIFGKFYPCWFSLNSMR